MKHVGKLAILVLFLLLSAWSIQQKDQQQNKPSQNPQGRPQNQQQPQQQPQAEGNNNPQPAPLFQGQSNLKSSRQGKDATVLGFNGIGPNGQVEKKVLEAGITSQDEQKAATLAAYSVNSGDVNAFIQEGHLKENK